MNNTLVDKMKEFLNKDKNFSTDKESMIKLIEPFNEPLKNSLKDLYYKIFAHADSFDWSRRKLEAILYVIVYESQENNIYYDDLYDTLTNLLDDLSGNVAWNSITMLKNEPFDKDELCNYVRSGKWRNED